jgi:hypothetical protein
MSPTALTRRSLTIITAAAVGTMLVPLGVFWVQGGLDPVAGSIGTLLAALVVVVGGLLTRSADP